MSLNYNSYIRYLHAKTTIDDRALNAHVWTTLESYLPLEPLDILEVGAGIGTMIERIAQRNLLKQSAYHAIDISEDHIATLQQRCAQLTCGLEISAEVSSLQAYANNNSTQYDLLIAHAVLDLLPLPKQLSTLFSLLKPDGLFYFSINFDGITAFEPTIDPQLDAQIQRLYHACMDNRSTGGDSQTGRHLLSYIPAAGGTILAAGSSDWIVYPRSDGRYHADDAYFLHFIIETVSNALRHHPELDPVAFTDWVKRRHQQIDAGKLIYIAHQLDVLGHV